MACLNVQHDMVGDLHARDLPDVRERLCLCNALHICPLLLELWVVCILPQSL